MTLLHLVVQEWPNSDCNSDPGATHSLDLGGAKLAGGARVGLVQILEMRNLLVGHRANLN